MFRKCSSKSSIALINSTILFLFQLLCKLFFGILNGKNILFGKVFGTKFPIRLPHILHAFFSQYDFFTGTMCTRYCVNSYVMIIDVFFHSSCSFFKYLKNLYLISIDVFIIPVKIFVFQETTGCITFLKELPVKNISFILFWDTARRIVLTRCFENMKTC